MSYSLYRQRLYIPVTSSPQLFLKRLCIGCMVLTVFVIFADVIRDSSVDKSTAYQVAQDFVTERLLNPSSAEFPPRSNYEVTVKYLGRHRLISSISPGKTIEGLIGGLAGGVITCVILCHITDTLNRLYLAVLLGIVLAGLGQLGDLAESIFKRDAKEKDSSDSVPGFGGLLDVVDSLLVAAPLAFLIFAVLPSR